MFGKPKKLKKLGYDIISYITIEGEAMRDSNDKQMIVAYAYKKLEFVDWYIQILQAGEAAKKKYTVPHSMEYLRDFRKQLSDVIKQIMAVKFPGKSEWNVKVDYPEDWQG
jgi:hypothetical protein